LVGEILKNWPGRWEDKSNPQAPHEAGLLQLSTDKAYAMLRWRPVWNFSEAVARTVGWYRTAQNFKDSRDFQALTQEQLDQYVARAAELKLPWTATAKSK
jgi:CDP-glucose 4,6-dehydratase